MSIRLPMRETPAFIAMLLILPFALLSIANGQNIGTPDQQAALKRVLRKGVTVATDSDPVLGLLISKEPLYVPLSVDDAQALGSLSAIQRLDIRDIRRLDEWLPLASKLKGLKRLSIQSEIVYNGHPSLTPSQWDALLKLEDLEALRIWDVSLMNVDVDRFDSLRKLRQIEFGWLSASPKLFAAIARIPDVRRVHFFGSRGHSRLVPDWQSLAKLQHLEDVDLGRLELRSAEMSGVELLPALRKLRFDVLEFDDRVLGALLACPRLEDLGVSCGRIAGRGLSELRASSTLKTAWCSSEEAIAEKDVHFLLDFTPRPQLWMRTAVSLDRIAKLFTQPITSLTVTGFDRNYRGERNHVVRFVTKDRDLETKRERFDDKDMAALGELRELRSLSLTRTSDAKRSNDVTCAGLKHLAELSKLERLTLDIGEPLTGESLRGLGGMPSLQEVHLRGVSLGPGSLDWVLQTPALRTLKIEDGQIHGEALTALRQLRTPIILTLERIATTGTRYEQIAHGMIGTLQLNHCAIDDDDLRIIGRNTKLQVLNIQGSTVSDTGLGHLVNCNALRSLSVLTKSEITLNGLRPLGALRNLTFIDAVGQGDKRLESEPLAQEFGWEFQGACGCTCMNTLPPTLLQINAEDLSATGRLQPMNKSTQIQGGIGLRLRGPLKVVKLEIHATEIPFPVQYIHLNDCQIGELSLVGVRLVEKPSCWGNSQIGKLSLQNAIPQDDESSAR